MKNQWFLVGFRSDMKTSKKPNDFDGLATPATGGPMKNDEKPVVFDRFSFMKTTKKSSDLDGLATPATGGPMKNDEKPVVFDGFSLMKTSRGVRSIGTSGLDLEPLCSRWCGGTEKG